MKKNTRSVSSMARLLRVESLESRQMLSATPWDASAAETVEVAAAERFDVVLFSADDQQETPELSFEATGEANQYQATWNATEDAVRYVVQRSKDGGDWMKVATIVGDESTPPATTATLNGVYSGKTYDFRVWALDANGGKVSAGEGSIVPVTLTTSLTDGYRAGTEITVKLKSGDPDDVSVVWYNVTDDGDVAIDGVDGLSYTPTEATCPIKVVATSSDTLGSTSEVTIPVNENKLGDGTFSEYDTVNRSVDLTWNVVDGAAGYRFLKGTTDDEGVVTWKKAATITVDENGAATNATISDDGTEMTYTIRMVNTGTQGLYRVVATDDAGRTLETQDFSFVAFGLQLDHDAYSTAGDTLDASLIPYTSDLYKATYQWYSSDDLGATWTEIADATTRQLTISADAAATGLFYKVVATNPATGFSASGIARPATLSALVDVAFSTDDAGVLNITFANTGSDFQIEYYNTDVANPVWLNLPISGVDAESIPGFVTVSQTNGTKYFGYDLRVRQVSDDAYSPWNTFSSEETYNVNERSVTLDWTDVHNALQYHVLIPSDTSESGWKVYANDLTESTVTITNGVGLGQSFAYQIVAYGVSGRLAELEDYFDATEYSIENATFDPYVTLSRNIDLSWDLFDDAASYRVYKDLGNTGTWKTAIKNIGVEKDGDGAYVLSPDTTSASVSLDGDRLTYTIGMFNAGVDASFKVVAVSEQGYILTEKVLTYKSIGLELDADVYDGVKVTELAANVVTGDDVTWQWYSSADQGVTWSILDGETTSTLTVDATAMPMYKVVATNADGYESVAYAYPEGPAPVVDFTVSVDDDDTLIFDFVGSDGATGYQVEYLYTDGAYPVWLNMTQITFTNNEDGSVTGTHVNGSNYIGYDMRARALGDGTASFWNQVSPAPVANVYVFAENIAEGIGFGDAAQGLSVSWDEVDDVDSYTLEEYDEDLQDWTVVLEGSDVSYSADAEPGVYSFRVKTNNEYASSEYNVFSVVVPELTFNTDLFRPGETVSVTAEAGGLTPESYQWYSYDGVNLTLLESETTDTVQSAPECGYLVCFVSYENSSFVAAAGVEGLPTETPSEIVTTADDVVDMYDGQISLREAVAYVQQGSTPSRTITFAADVQEIALNSEIVVTDTGSAPIAIDGGSAVTLTGGSLFSVDGSNANAALELRNLTIANTTDALSVSGSNGALTLTNVVSSGNVASDASRGVVTATNGGSLTIDRMNSNGDGDATTGAIVCVDGANATVANSLFSGNSAYYSPAVAFFNTAGRVNTLANLTIADNTIYCNDDTYTTSTVDSKKGAGLYLESAASVCVYNILFYNNNNIAFGNNVDFVAYGTGYSTQNWATMDSFYYNGSYEVEVAGSFRRTNLVADPTFSDGYIPAPGSSLVDSGNTSKAFGDYDFAGNARVSGANVDIGAYEYQQPASEALLDEAFEDYFADDSDF